ncbi:carbohydrate porin [Azonexus sp.]|jgi:hypothetical protein|uniref:carbohydrate porin n=1 Tax=Azonexus sp. TaxID=1872668 RepID=UPI00281B2C98|nr:carbohydrate porin [Azonexus sp.]MDR1994739.1 carbohydrate porin [Azonexus sp.]
MRCEQLTAALVVAGSAMPVLAADSQDALLEKLAARLERLEARNTELEKEVRELKSENQKIADGLDSPRLSENEPELTARLKAVEKDALDMKKAARIAEKLDGIAIGASLTTVAQHASGLPKHTADSGSQLDYRADVTVALPLKPIGDIEHKVFAHFRVGQGLGLNKPFANLGYFASAPNAVAFRASGSNPDDSVAILGQAWYQAAIPLPLGGFRPYSREKLEITFGKMDIFGFFDQNNAAGDESVQFLNSVFVHNPLLDAGGEVAPDANGFQPGAIISYLDETDKSEPWRLSLGVFGAGERGASYQRGLNSPLVMLQAEKRLRLFDGLVGNYRAYAWTRNKVDEFDGATTARHTGFGLSIDQQVSDGVKLFGRYGQLVQGRLPFEHALSLGGEINGGYWGRAGDAIGIGGSWLKASNAYHHAGGSGDIDGDGNPDFSFTPRGAEKIAEIYYRYRVSPNLEISPDFQWIARPGGNGDANSVKVYGLRVSIAY